jgi:hypothetical protein
VIPIFTKYLLVFKRLYQKIVSDDVGNYWENIQYLVGVPYDEGDANNIPCDFVF